MSEDGRGSESLPVQNRMTIRFLVNAKTYFRTCLVFFYNLTGVLPSGLKNAGMKFLHGSHL